jgi:hypothetical protein
MMKRLEARRRCPQNDADAIVKRPSSRRFLCTLNVNRFFFDNSWQSAPNGRRNWRGWR